MYNAHVLYMVQKCLFTSLLINVSVAVCASPSSVGLNMIDTSAVDRAGTTIYRYSAKMSYIHVHVLWDKAS